jgi:hypothetical protein
MVKKNKNVLIITVLIGSITIALLIYFLNIIMGQSSYNIDSRNLMVAKMDSKFHDNKVLFNSESYYKYFKLYHETTQKILTLEGKTKFIAEKIKFYSDTFSIDFLICQYDKLGISNYSINSLNGKISIKKCKSIFLFLNMSDYCSDHCFYIHNNQDDSKYIYSIYSLKNIDDFKYFKVCYSQEFDKFINVKSLCDSTSLQELVNNVELIIPSVSVGANGNNK